MTEQTIQNRLYYMLRSAAQCLMPNFTPGGWWECDLATVTRAGYFVEYEIKLSLSARPDADLPPFCQAISTAMAGKPILAAQSPTELVYAAAVAHFSA